MPRAVATLLAIALAVAFVAAPTSAHVGFEFEGHACDLVHHWWYYKGKEMYTHNAAYLFPGAPVGAQQQFVLSMDDGGHDPEYGTLIPFAEDAHGRLKACQALAAIEADATALAAAQANALLANPAAASFNFHGYAYQINCNPNTWAPQVTFGVQLSSVWAMFRALHANNAIGAGAINHNYFTAYLAADATWANNLAMAALSNAQKGFVLLIAAMRLGGNEANPYASPKQRMDFIMHSTWDRVRNELTAGERAALLVVAGGQHAATTYADLLVTSVINNMAGGVVAGLLNTLPLHAQMYRGGWTLAGVNMSPTFNQWVHDVLNSGTDLLRNNPITRVANRIGNMNAVDVVHGANHLIMEMRLMAPVNTAGMATTALKWYDFFARWNAAAAGVVVGGVALAAPTRVMEVSTGVVVTAALAPAYPSLGNGCATTLQNTCQPHAAVNINTYFPAVAAAEVVRIAGGGGVAGCFLDHNSKAASVKLHRRKRLAKAKAEAEANAATEAHEHCAEQNVPNTKPRSERPSPFANVAALEKAIADGQKQNPNEKLPQEILDALAYAKELQKKQQQQKQGGK